VKPPDRPHAFLLCFISFAPRAPRGSGWSAPRDLVRPHCEESSTTAVRPARGPAAVCSTFAGGLPYTPTNTVCPT